MTFPGRNTPFREIGTQGLNEACGALEEPEMGLSGTADAMKPAFQRV
jgi:hypothetical protein